MGLTPAEMYKLFFGSQEMRPELTEDAGLSCNRPDTQVSSLVSGHIVGERSNFKKFPTYTQDHGDGIATRGESVVHVPS